MEISRKSLAIIFILILIIISGGVAFYFYHSDEKKPTEKPVPWRPAKASFSGTISKMEGDLIWLENQAELESAGGSVNDYPIKITSASRIIRYLPEMKSESEYLAERAEFEKKSKELSENRQDAFGLEVSSWNKSEKISLSDLRQGDSVNALVILKNGQYIAELITIDPLPVEKKQEETAEAPMKEEFEGVIAEVDLASGVVLMGDSGKGRRFSFSSSTEVYLRKQKSAEQFYREQEAFKKSMVDKDQAKRLPAPSWHVFESISANVIKPGQKAFFYVTSRQGQLYMDRLEISE